MKLEDIESGDRLCIDDTTFEGCTFKVRDANTEETVVGNITTLLCTVGCERYAISGSPRGTSATVTHLDGDTEWGIMTAQIREEDAS